MAHIRAKLSEAEAAAADAREAASTASAEAQAASHMVCACNAHLLRHPELYHSRSRGWAGCIRPQHSREGGFDSLRWQGLPSGTERGLTGLTCAPCICGIVPRSSGTSGRIAGVPSQAAAASAEEMTHREALCKAESMLAHEHSKNEEQQGGAYIHTLIPRRVPDPDACSAATTPTAQRSAAS